VARTSVQIHGHELRATPRLAHAGHVGSASFLPDEPAGTHRKTVETIIGSVATSAQRALATMRARIEVTSLPDCPRRMTPPLRHRPALAGRCRFAMGRRSRRRFRAVALLKGIELGVAEGPFGVSSNNECGIDPIYSGRSGTRCLSWDQRPVVRAKTVADRARLPSANPDAPVYCRFSYCSPLGRGRCPCGSPGNPSPEVRGERAGGRAARSRKHALRVVAVPSLAEQTA
jgi:hypothetical protein